MRRSLVLTNEAARHPFRASLPAHVFRVAEQPARPRAWRLTWHDLRDFLLAYCASSVAAFTFIF